MATANAKEYLDYLDKEMTIMGILSTFCVAAVALTLDRIGNADLSKDTVFRRIWERDSTFVLVGSGWLLLAALCFYLQRSLLAYYYGGISLSLNNPEGHPWSTSTWLVEAYSWAVWIRCRIGFMCLVLAASCFSAALVGATGSGHQLPSWILWALPALIAIEQVPHCWVLCRFRHNSEPFHTFLASLRHPKPPRRTGKK